MTRLHHSPITKLALLAVALLGLLHASRAAAAPTLVEHNPAAQVFGETAGVTQREPDLPREDEAVALFFRVSFQFTYDRVAIYYTTDGTEPNGTLGVGSVGTLVVTNLAGVSFLRNEFTGEGTRDWWKWDVPPALRAYGANVRYKISAWSTSGGPEVFASGGLAFSWTNKLAWPGAGAGQPNPGAGYPPVSFWKEEAIFGNGYCAGMIDQNGTVYDFHFPTPGGVQGVGTRNEGYVGGLDTFPPGLPSGWRGQMHINQAMAGVRVDGVTHWLSNPSGVSYSGVTQWYLDRTNTIRTTQNLSGANISIEQLDFSPLNITFPQDLAGDPQRHLYIKRLRLTNNGPSPRTVNVYWYLDPALNGGDTHDAMFVDGARAAMVAYDNTYRVVTGTGTGFSSPNEYNPTTSPGYEKDRSLYLACAMKVLDAAGNTLSGATDFWRDTSADNGQGWMGARVTLPPGTPVEVNIIMAGAMDPFAGATGTYAFKLQNAMQWFYTASMPVAMSQTAAHWDAWLDAGVTVDTPDDIYDWLFERSLLATALHTDAVNGGVIAGFHNGAYPYVWPRDAVYAAVTLARTGHLTESRAVYDWMKNTTYRDFESWGRKGFWKQKYTTDGYVVWGAPQIDETAVFPWGVWYQYQMTADTSMLASYVDQVRDSIESMTRDSSDSRLRFEEAFNLVYSNNVWEDSYDTFVYSNANVVRGLWDAGSILNSLGLFSEAASATGKGNMIKSGLDARLDWNGENTDVSQLGIVYPFSVYSPTDPRAALVVDRINGVATDRFGNNHPLINFSGEHQDTVNRYWGDSYWNGGPWFLTTLWYGLYYAQRADLTQGSADIDNHKHRIDLMIDRIGPVGMGAEQIAYSTGPGASPLYPGQPDFLLQTAWPNAWESMSTFIDSIMAFLDFQPDAPSNTIVVAPKLPSDWNTMTFRGVTLVNTPAGHTHRVDITAEEDDALGLHTHTFTNTSGHPLNAGTTIRVPAGSPVYTVTRNGAPWPFTHNNALGAVTIAPAPLDTGANAQTTFTVTTDCPADVTNDGSVDVLDFLDFIDSFGACENQPGPCAGGSGVNADFNADTSVDVLDFLDFFDRFGQGC